MLSLCACESGPDDALTDAGGSDAEVDAPGADAQIDAEIDAAGPVSNGGCTGALALCDIRDDGCQRSVAEEVACLRGTEPVMPAVELLTADEYRDWLDSLSLQPDPTLRHWLGGLATFGLAVEGMLPDEGGVQVDQIAAAYSEDTKRITIIDRGMPIDDFNAVTVLAHELVHAQQDAERGLTAWRQRWAHNFDRTVAANTVVEGEAVHYEMLVAHALASVPVDDIDWDALYDQWKADGYAYFHEVDSPFLAAPLVLPYPFGGALATQSWLSDGTDGIDALFEAPPRSSRELMFGDASGETDAQAKLIMAALPVFTTQFRPVRFDALGAFVFREFLLRAGASEETAMSAAEQLGADVFAVLVHREDGSLVATWRLQLLPGAETAWLDELDLDRFAVLEERSRITFITGPEDLLLFPEILRWDAAPALP